MEKASETAGFASMLAFRQRLSFPNILSGQWQMLRIVFLHVKGWIVALFFYFERYIIRVLT